MKTYILDIIPKIQKFSKKLDKISVLTEKHWVMLDDSLNEKLVYIFREKENQLLISADGKVEKGTWEYLGNNSLLIDKNNESFLFKHGFIDDYILALKIDGKDEYAILVNEQKFNEQLNSISTILTFLEITYVEIEIKKPDIIPQLVNNDSVTLSSNYKTKVNSIDKFDINLYPELVNDIRLINQKLETLDGNYNVDILLSFSRDHKINANLINSFPDFAEIVINKKIQINLIEKIFQNSKEKPNYRKEFEEYLIAEIGKSSR